MTALATTLPAFFTDRLVRQRQVSPNTLCAYRDTVRLLLVFASDRKGNAPSKLDLDVSFRQPCEYGIRNPEAAPRHVMHLDVPKFYAAW